MIRNTIKSFFLFLKTKIMTTLSFSYQTSGQNHLLPLKNPLSVLLSLIVTVRKFVVTSVTTSFSRLPRHGFQQSSSSGGPETWGGTAGTLARRPGWHRVAAGGGASSFFWQRLEWAKCFKCRGVWWSRQPLVL